jgi:hypothetical protein
MQRKDFFIRKTIACLEKLVGNFGAKQEIYFAYIYGANQTITNYAKIIGSKK